MLRVFWGLAGGQLLLLTGAVVLGIVADGQMSLNQHVALGVFTALAVCFCHAVVLTYFTVTGKLIHQAIALGAYHRGPYALVRKLKKRVVRTVVVGFLSIIVVVATGARALSLIGLENTHLLAVMFGFTLNLIAYLAQYQLIARNERLLNRILKRYGDLRSETVVPAN